ncbi:MAG: SEC-C domain-containing protein [Bryobacterales bacterium]|nr:SEC-C domain-containing protein [Bryobacterales bacterium]
MILVVAIPLTIPRPATQLPRGSTPPLAQSVCRPLLEKGEPIFAPHAPHRKKCVHTKPPKPARRRFEHEFRYQFAMLTRRALETIDEILNNPDTSPSVRLKAALAVLKQDWKLPRSTDFDTVSQPAESLRNELAPETESGPFDTFRHLAPNEINDVRNELASEPAAKPQPVRSHKIGRNVPCPCGSNLKYKRCCGK